MIDIDFYDLPHTIKNQTKKRSDRAEQLESFWPMMCTDCGSSVCLGVQQGTKTSVFACSENETEMHSRSRLE